MRSRGFSLSEAWRAIRTQWRLFLLVSSIALIAVTCLLLYVHGSELTESVALIVGGTVMGMLGIAYMVYRR